MIKTKEGFRITDHALNRAKNRAGMGGKSIIRFVSKAWNLGLGLKDVDGAMKVELLDKKSRHGGNLKVYGHYIYIFRGKTLITVLNLPDRLWSHWDNRGDGLCQA